MLSTLLAKLGLGDGSYNTSADTRRKYIRMPGARAEVELGSQALRVRDWSQGGISFDTMPDTPINEGDRVVVTLRFRLPHETVSMQRPLRIVRAGAHGAAAEFAPLSNDDRKQFARVLDSYHAEEFLASQAA